MKAWTTLSAWGRRTVRRIPGLPGGSYELVRADVLHLLLFIIYLFIIYLFIIYNSYRRPAGLEACPH